MLIINYNVKLRMADL